MTHISMSAGELNYLCLLLAHVKGPTCFDDIKTVDGKVHINFREACFAKGLLDDDKEFIDGITEAAIWATGYSLRQLLFQCFYEVHLVAIQYK